MNKYKLINKQTGESHLCDKVEIDGFDYYVSNDELNNGSWILSANSIFPIFLDGGDLYPEMLDQSKWRKVIATSNPNIDCPKVVDVVEEITKYEGYTFRIGFKHGYNKSQETHPNSDEDMIEFAGWAVRRDWKDVSSVFEKSTKELLQLWKEQKPKTIYYE